MKACVSASLRRALAEVAEDKLEELVELLLNFPEVSVFIVGNIGNAQEHIKKGNSKEALDQDGFYLNGETTSARKMMSARAKAIYDYLIETKHVPRGQLDYGPGSIYEDIPTGQKVSFEIRSNR